MFTFFKFPAALGILIACHDQILVYALAGGASKGGCISVTGSTLDPIGSKEKGLGLSPGVVVVRGAFGSPLLHECLVSVFFRVCHFDLPHSLVSGTWGIV